MKCFGAFVIALVFSVFVQAQNSARQFEIVGKFSLDDPAERILAYDFFDDGARLRLIGERSIRFWDVRNKKVVSSQPHGIENLQFPFAGEFSPDRRKFIVFSYKTKEKNSPSEIVPAKIYDADTGKILAVFDKGKKQVRGAVWSRDGKILTTASDSDFTKDYGYRYALGGEDEIVAIRPEAVKAAGDELVGNKVADREISFFNADTFELRASISINNITWRYLSFDGKWLFLASGPKRNLLGFDYVSEKAETIDVWNTRTGKLETQLPVGDKELFTRTRKLMVSPDGKSLAFVIKSRQSDADDKLIVWELDGSETPKYSVKANPKIADSELGYSPDGKLVALDAGKNAQFYALSSGAKQFEISNFEVPDVWLNSGRFVLFHKFDRIQGFSMPDGKRLFEEKVAYRTADYGTGIYTQDPEDKLYKEDEDTQVVDYTVLRPHPREDLFMTFSNELVKIYSPQGAVLQTLVAPPPGSQPKKRKILGIPLPDGYDWRKSAVVKADWVNDGKMVAVELKQENAVAVWEMKN